MVIISNPEAMRKRFYEYLIEALLIVFSVIFALFLNEYRTNLKANRELDVMLSNVKTEVEINKRIIEDLIPYHQGVLDRLDAVLASDSAISSISSESGPDLSAVLPQGVFQRSVNSSAWEVTKSTGMISQLDVDQAQHLSRTYTQQEITFMPVYDIYDMVTERDFLNQENTQGSLIILGMHLGEILGREKTLLLHYDEALKFLK